MTKTTNNERARLANTALSAFVLENGDSGNDETNLVDLLTNMMHLCDAQGWGFDAVLLSAHLHHHNETLTSPKADEDFANG